MRPVIEAHDLGIRFYLNRRRKRRLRSVLTTGRSGAAPREFWALRHVGFSVQEGEAVGLVGANGHGKSTLLRLIAGVMIPDEGRVAVHGGVAPLIELTGGFVGELSARDNVYLTGGLHGLSRRQIDERFSEIIEFAGVEDFVDTPFRHFSSGMKARLGFSVVTSLDEPIILADEVMAVGDRAFRERCYTRLEEMLAQGRTLFIVSHSDGTLRRFCRRGLYLRHGELMGDGDLEDVLEKYSSDADD